MQITCTRAVMAIIAFGAISWHATVATPSAHAQTAASNELQRSVGVYAYAQAGKGGPARGEVLYYYKCWFCHNDYARAAGSPAPTLKDIFKRENLVTGEPVNDETVANHIRKGSPQMPAFGTTLKDADVADLIAYLRNGCCYEEGKPPRNPWYRASAQNSAQMPARGNLRGGPKGIVRTADGQTLDGIQVQLIAANAVRTTVTTNESGASEFPQLLPGSYTLRIARPVEFLPRPRDAAKPDDAARLGALV